MATFQTDKVRALAIELQNKARTLYQTILPIYRASGAWELNALDPDLPLPYDIKVQIAEYKTLKVDPLRLTDWDSEILTAQPGDTLE
jgi:hypothetical protein